MTGAQLRTRRRAATRALRVAGGSVRSGVTRTSSCHPGGAIECGRMRSVVTGGAGFIGSNLVDALLDAGDEVLVVDDLSTGRIENLEAARRRGIAFHECDITDAERLRTAFTGTP